VYEIPAFSAFPRVAHEQGLNHVLVRVLVHVHVQENYTDTFVHVQQLKNFQ
jgi:hypothetical protein